MSVNDLCFKKGNFVEIGVVGEPSSFYVYDRNKRTPWSNWLTSSTGAREYLPKFVLAKKNKDKKEFQRLIDEIFEKYGAKII